MKKLLLIFSIFLSGVLPTASQNDFKSELSFGVNAGATLSSVRFYPSLRQASYQRLVGGLTVRYITENHFGLQAELNYSQRGWKEQDEDRPAHKNTRSLDYIEFPFLTHIYFNVGGPIRMVFNLGPQISYLISEKQTEWNPVYSENNLQLAQMYDYIQDHKVERPFDWGICGGGGFELKTGIGKFVAEGRYYFGLSDIFNNRREDAFQSSAHQVISIKLTYFHIYK